MATYTKIYSAIITDFGWYKPFYKVYYTVYMTSRKKIIIYKV